MNKKASVEAQWFIVFGIVLVGITSLALFFRIGSIMDNEDFFYEFHSDQLVALIESITTSRNPTAIVYSLGDFNITSFELRKQDGSNAELILQPRGVKELIVPMGDSYNVQIDNVPQPRLLISYNEGTFDITNLEDCGQNSDITNIEIYTHNPKEIEMNNPDAYVYIVASNREFECRIRNNLILQNPGLERSNSIATTIQPNLHSAYGGTHDAIITIFNRR